jgi:hypothetical protein
MKLVRPVLAASAGVLMLSLAACGGGNDSQATDAQQGSQQGGQGGYGAGGQGGGQGAGRFPGANGLVAAISGKTLQVQGQSGQTAVTYTGSTSFTAQVTAKVSDVVAGSCVVVMPVQDSGSSSSGSADTTQTAITAASVRITPAQNGTCDGGFGGARGDRPSGAPSGMPTDLPSGAPSGAPSGMPSGRPGGRGMFGAFGKVLAAADNGFTVMSSAPGGSSGSSTSTTVNVTVTADTTYTATRTATAKALAVGKCVSANGQSDDTGAVTAQRITVSDAVDGQCTGGFGGFGGGFGGRQGASS